MNANGNTLPMAAMCDSKAQPGARSHVEQVGDGLSLILEKTRFQILSANTCRRPSATSTVASTFLKKLTLLQRCSILAGSGLVDVINLIYLVVVCLIA